MSPNADRAHRWLRACTGLMSLLAVTGVANMFLRSPDSATTAKANSGQPTEPRSQTTLQFFHDSLAVVLIIGLLVGGGWILLKVSQNPIGTLAGGLVALAIAAYSGWLLSYDLVDVGGVLVDDRGIWFIFDGEFRGAWAGNQFVGSTAYRVALVVHLVAAASFLMALWRTRSLLERRGPDIFAEGRRSRGSAIDRVTRTSE